ncbi:hypothetical protein Pla123a_04310 [Posidoniimonas polymericola]|uniref:Transposase IS200-like domain-containing protein n=1 Tax=Posidoniimonas polymericola TaxID=2528002 RepID=A0A5C5ZE47_9BACT|nr:hypothetical protein [Posidoniimonas polymericola]TWT85624.1 hypothetical protein Pla123a_04310 [Posidoniimonas polymericola]
MPCFLFTYHAYGTWLPDRSEGYVQRKRGLLFQDVEMGRIYRHAMTADAVVFDGERQLVAIEAVLNAARCVDLTAHSIATETTHVHALVSWASEQRTWLQNRSSVKKAITLALQQGSDRKQWLSDSASRKQVKDRNHFAHLLHNYLPSHRGWKWDEQKGRYQ